MRFVSYVLLLCSTSTAVLASGSKFDGETDTKKVVSQHTLPSTFLSSEEQVKAEVIKGTILQKYPDLQGRLGTYPPGQLLFAWQIMDSYGIWGTWHSGGDFASFLDILKDYPLEKLNSDYKWMMSLGFLLQGSNKSELSIVFESLKDCDTSELLAGYKWIKATGAWEKCQRVFQFVQMLKMLKGYPADKLSAAHKWMISSGAWNKCSSLYEIEGILRILKNYPVKKFNDNYKWMLDSGTWGLYGDGNSISSIFSILRDYPTEQFKADYEWMLCTKLREKIVNGSDLNAIFYSMKSYGSVKFKETYQWLMDTGAWDKCQTTEQLCGLLRALEKYNVDTRQNYYQWMVATGAWAKCKDEYEISNLLNALDLFSQNVLGQQYQWIKAAGSWDKCQNGRQINAALRLICDLRSGLYIHYVNALKNTGILNQAFFHQCLLNWRKREYNSNAIAECILSGQREFVSFYDYRGLYLLCHLYYRPNPAVLEAIKEGIHNPKVREDYINTLVLILGEDHPFTQECIHIALGYNNQSDPDGFLAVHQEMVAKSQQGVQHNHRSATLDVVLNLDSVRQPRPAAPIHMPVNVWYRLFDELRQIGAEERQAFTLILGDVSWNTLMELKHNDTLVSLLDPENSLCASENVSSHSQMLRAVLQNIQQTRNMAAFLQLLVNITTCTTGKLEGITHSHIFLNQGRVLDESVLGSEAFKEQIFSFLQEEFRRFREGTLIHIVKSITGGVDPHNRNYVRGIIGREIGLMFENEKPYIDLNANDISALLRKKSKQDFLDLFYQYYKPDDLIDRFHAMLHNGTLKIGDQDDKQDLTISIINIFLQGDAMDEGRVNFDTSTVVLDEHNNPIGLTPLAAKRLLVMLGFLRVVG